MAESQTVYEIENITGKHEFLNKEKTIVVFKDEIEANDVIQCLKHCIKSGIWAKESRILIASGFHTSKDGQIGETSSTFTGLIGRQYPQLLEDCREELKQLKYSFESVELNTYPTHTNFKLQEFSICNLKSRFLHVLDSKEPYAMIFATCFSGKSVVNNHINATGVYSALLLSSERGSVTEGKDFQLDEQQKHALRHFHNVCKNKLFFSQ